WISVPGRLTRPALRELHWDAHAFVSMARLEAFGIAALEARTAGLPIVGLAGTGMDDFVHDGVEGLLATDDEDVARALARLATDPDLRTRIRDHNRTTPPEQAWPDIVEATLAEYHRAIEQGRRS
ncbi:MAG TPA: glycosyltransferase, partial [Phycicoccus sp.]|nr:glycosyltransferase [Phycicoccus sp.]